MTPCISVIIPTYKDIYGLAKCLQCLEMQSIDKTDFEVLVVNNDPDGTDLRSIALSTNASIINEPRPGSYAARNRGAQCANYPLLAFTDSDCLPSVDWLEKIQKFYSEYEMTRTDCPITAGGVELFPREVGYYTFSEAYDYLVGLNQHLYVRKGVAATANLSVPRAVFEFIGGFDEALFSGGDTDFCLRARQSGVELHYLADAVVHHPLRHSATEVLRKDRRLVGAKFGRARTKTVLMSLSPPIIRISLILKERDVAWGVRLKALLFLVRVWVARLLEVGRLLLSPSATRVR